MFENGPAEAAEREAPSGREAGSLEEGGQRHHTKSSNQAMLCVQRTATDPKPS
jgi:hypothetical protein